MSHTSEKRWANYKIETTYYEGVSVTAGPLLKDFLRKLVEIEEAYQQMQEIYIYAGGNVSDLAELLFKEDIASRTSPFNVASQEELDKTNDLVEAMKAAHELYEAANNVAVTQSDRLTAIRRMI